MTEESQKGEFMSIGGIGNYGYANGYAYGNYLSSSSAQQTTGFSSAGVTSEITLHYTDGESGDTALTAVGFPDGSSASVYKADNYNDANPEYRVRYWNKSGEYEDINVKINDVDPTNASFIEMLAYATYSDVQGYTQNAYGDFLSATQGVGGNMIYDETNINQKYDFKSLVLEFMTMQYKSNNLAGYHSCKQFYDYMNDRVVS